MNHELSASQLERLQLSYDTLLKSLQPFVGKLGDTMCFREYNTLSQDEMSPIWIQDFMSLIRNNPGVSGENATKLLIDLYKNVWDCFEDILILSSKYPILMQALTQENSEFDIEACFQPIFQYISDLGREFDIPFNEVGPVFSDETVVEFLHLIPPFAFRPNS